MPGIPQDRGIDYSLAGVIFYQSQPLAELIGERLCRSSVSSKGPEHGVLTSRTGTTKLLGRELVSEMAVIEIYSTQVRGKATKEGK